MKNLNALAIREQELEIELELAKMGVAVADSAAPIPLITLEFRGGAKAIQDETARESMLAGPAETGKTIASLTKLHNVAAENPNAQLVMLRATQKSAYATVMQSWEKKVLAINGWNGVEKYGGEKPEFYQFSNGSRVWLGGLDNADKWLSGEFDGIYINQAEEVQLADWEKLVTRVSGRAGNVKHPQIWGDCNPGPPSHWIKQRASEGKLKFYDTTHKDNPRLWDVVRGDWTPAGVQTMETLDALTGVRRLRLKDGKWVQAEGVVYEDFNQLVHIIDPFTIPDTWARYRCIDFGYKNPFVCQWWAMDGDGRLYLYREIYHTRRTVAQHAPLINELSEGEQYVDTIADHDAEDVATLRQNGIPSRPAVKDVTTGIQAVADRLKVAGDGKPRLYVFRGATVEIDPLLADAKVPTGTAQEFEYYMWEKGAAGRKEVPVKEYDHGMDAMRYIVKRIDGRKQFAYGS